MLIDHVGIVLDFFDHKYLQIVFRLIGRISFPLFAFLLTQGHQHTKNKKRYIKRIFIFALVSHIPYQLFRLLYDINVYNNNIFFTLLFSLIIFEFYDKLVTKSNTREKSFYFLLMTILLIISEILKFEYGCLGLLLSLSFKKNFLENLSIRNNYFFLPTIILLFIYPLTSIESFLFLLFSLISLIIISKYNNKLGHSFKYISYLFYPLHLIILCLFRKKIFS
jgi:hypothetical protein